MVQLIKAFHKFLTWGNNQRHTWLLIVALKCYNNIIYIQNEADIPFGFPSSLTRRSTSTTTLHLKLGPTQARLNRRPLT